MPGLRGKAACVVEGAIEHNAFAKFSLSAALIRSKSDFAISPIRAAANVFAIMRATKSSGVVSRPENAADIASKFEEFMRLDEQVISLYRAGDPASLAEANRLVLEDETEIFTSIADGLENFTSVAVADAHQHVLDVEHLSGEGRQITLTVIAISLLATIALARLISRSITRPLHELHGRLVEIADAAPSCRIAAGSYCGKPTSCSSTAHVAPPSFELSATSRLLSS